MKDITALWANFSEKEYREGFPKLVDALYQTYVGKGKNIIPWKERTLTEQAVIQLVFENYIDPFHFIQYVSKEYINILKAEDSGQSPYFMSTSTGLVAAYLLNNRKDWLKENWPLSKDSLRNLFHCFNFSFE